MKVLTFLAMAIPLTCLGSEWNDAEPYFGWWRVPKDLIDKTIDEMVEMRSDQPTIGFAGTGGLEEAMKRYKEDPVGYLREIAREEIDGCLFFFGKDTNNKLIHYEYRSDGTLRLAYTDVSAQTLSDNSLQILHHGTKHFRWFEKNGQVLLFDPFFQTEYPLEQLKDQSRRPDRKVDPIEIQ